MRPERHGLGAFSDDRLRQQHLPEIARRSFHNGDGINQALRRQHRHQAGRPTDQPRMLQVGEGGWYATDNSITREPARQ